MRIDVHSTNEPDATVRVLTVTGTADPHHPALVAARQLVEDRGSPQALREFDRAVVLDLFRSDR